MANGYTVEPWSPSVQIPSTIAHVVGILTTIFRLLYRWHLSKFWWEDMWATLALICDIACLVSIWMQTAPDHPHTTPQINLDSSWLHALTITSVLWFARMSILCSIVRIANPAPGLRRVAYGIGAMFLVVGAGLLAQKVFICMENFCRITNSVAVAQLVTDIISDIVLVAVPVRFLRDVKLSRDRRIFIILAFSASILITGVTILHSLLLFEAATNVTIIIGHIKAALALFLCNALVLVMFAYRLCQSAIGLNFFMTEGRRAEVGSNPVEFTSIIELPSKFSSHLHPGTSGIQNRGDATCTKAFALSTSAGPESHTTQSETAVAFRGAEDPRCDYQACKVEVAGHEQVQVC